MSGTPASVAVAPPAAEDVASPTETGMATTFRNKSESAAQNTSYCLQRSVASVTSDQIFCKASFRQATRVYMRKALTSISVSAG